MIASLHLTNFRSFEELSVEFEKQVNIIVGPNASGKTNLLEALLISCIGKSYRSTDEELINRSKDWARIEVVLDNNKKRTTQVRADPLAKKFTIDGNEFKRLPAQYKLPVVLFEPNQLVNMTSSPELRRGLIDNLLDQLSPIFAQNRRSYNRALAQRNSLLKSPNQAQKNIFAWNVRLCELAGSIVSSRQEIIDTINQQIANTYSQLADKEHRLDLRYESRLETKNYANSMLKRLESTLDQDIERGFTTTGPHRDDVTFWIDDSNLKVGASRGEVRTTLLSFKLSEARLLQEIHKQPPHLLLDDVFGELDGARRKTLTKFLKQYQSFITTTDADVVTKNMKNSNIVTT